jgi:hypothetical protein
VEETGWCVGCQQYRLDLGILALVPLGPKGMVSSTFPPLPRTRTQRSCLVAGAAGIQDMRLTWSTVGDSVFLNIN